MPQTFFKGCVINAPRFIQRPATAHTGSFLRQQPLGDRVLPYLDYYIEQKHVRTWRNLGILCTCPLVILIPFVRCHRFSIDIPSRRTLEKWASPAKSAMPGPNSTTSSCWIDLRAHFSQSSSERHRRHQERSLAGVNDIIFFAGRSLSHIYIALNQPRSITCTVTTSYATHWTRR